jgi:hypothetical protein
LRLGTRLFDPECISLELRPPGRIFGPDFFRIVEYDSDAKVLVVEVLNAELPLETAPPNAVSVVSDLRFLVENVKRWYASNGLQLQLPAAAPAGIVTDETTDLAAEDCQKEASSLCLTTPLTYIWGPPGTGKTRHVLVHAVLQLLRRQKRIGLFAPTNNALEQAMTPIINAAEAEGISRDRFLRVGHPSAKFANSFPEVCEVRGLQRQLSELRQQIANYNAVLNYRRGATVLNSVPMLKHELDKLQDLLRERRQVCAALAQIRKNLLSRAVSYFDGRRQALNDSLDPLETQINGQLEMIRRTRTDSPKLNAILDRADFTNAEKTEEKLSGLENEIHKYMAVNEALAEEYKNLSDEDLQRLKVHLEGKLESLKAQTLQERIRSAWATGMTLDCFIGRFHDTLLTFDHIFMDEAGYAPLVKALTLCRNGIPLSLIGDHMQLGPVCEMSDDSLSMEPNNPAVVWSKSALFLDEVFLAENQEELVHTLLQINEPRLSSFSRGHLNRTFRFGQNLADILSTHIYQGLELVSGADHQDLEIVCINAVPCGRHIPLHQCHAEVEIISSFLRELTDADTDMEESFAILTPYRKQVALLGNSLPEARRQGRIMTVHKSQGREWDTVIISIVDGRFNRPWFTDTTNVKSRGIHVMNTAISRARKRLILVCDVDFWQRQDPEQLIFQLLKLTDSPPC